MARASTRYASLRPLPVGPMRKTQWRMASSSDSCTTRSTKSSSGVSPISTAVARMTSSKSMSRLRGGSTPAQQCARPPRVNTAGWGVWGVELGAGGAAGCRLLDAECWMQAVGARPQPREPVAAASWEHPPCSSWQLTWEEVVEQAGEDDHVLRQDLRDVEVAQRAVQHVRLHLLRQQGQSEGSTGGPVASRAAGRLPRG